MVSGSLVGFASSLPPTLDQHEVWEEFFGTHYSNSRLARRVWRSAGVDRRHAAVDPRVEDLSRAGTAHRMNRFAELALPLACDAVSRCLANSNLDPTDIDLLTVASCTGYTTPGIDILVAKELGMPVTLQRLHVGHMGCYAAIPALASATDAASARGKVGVLLCIELTSLHVQPPTTDVEQIVAHALFSDAAAAVAVVPDAAGLEVVDVVACTDASTSDLMSWRVTDLGFRMTLSSKVSAVLDRHVLALTTELVERHDLTLADIDRWAIHPGGPKIVETVARRLNLADEAVAVSRETLRLHGNCSSATVLLVLEEMLRQDPLRPGQHIVAMAFGPGLTLYAALLRAR